MNVINDVLIISVVGRTETTTDVLKSILAIYFFREKARKLKEAGCDFSKHLVVPENDSTTGEQIHQREDHNHLLKRIIACLREGVIPGIDLCHFRDALHDPHTGLTYEAVTGKNKQSVPDCERMISPGVITFMESNGHHEDAKILRLLHNWHKAVDGRGLTEEERSLHCKSLLKWIIEDWIPWAVDNPDYSLLDVNRYNTPVDTTCTTTSNFIAGLNAVLNK